MCFKWSETWPCTLNPNLVWLSLVSSIDDRLTLTPCSLSACMRRGWVGLGLGTRVLVVTVLVRFYGSDILFSPLLALTVIRVVNSVEGNFRPYQFVCACNNIFFMEVPVTIGFLKDLCPSGLLRVSRTRAALRVTHVSKLSSWFLDAVQWRERVDVLICFDFCAS